MSECNCQPQNFPFSCQRGNCPLKECRPAKFESAEQVLALRSEPCNGKAAAPAPDEARLTILDLPCPHRGEVLRQVYRGCGNRGELVDVYACAAEGEATLQATGKCNKKEIVAPGTGTKLPACVGCEKNPSQEKIVSDNVKTISNVQELQQRIADRRAQMQQRRANSPMRVARQEGNTIHLEFDKKIVGPIRMALAYLETMEQDDPKRWNDFIIDGLKQADEMLKQGMTIVKESPKKDESVPAEKAG